MSNIKLFQGDCLEIMKNIPDKSIDMILTDPPYGTTACKWDSVIPFEPMWEQLERIIKDNGAICLFGSEPFSSALRMSNIKRYRYDWYWEKDKGSNIFMANKMPMKNIENISVFYKHLPLYIPQMRAGKPYIKIQKNSKLGEHLVDQITKPSDKINESGLRYPLQNLYFARDTSKGSSFHPTQKPIALCEYFINTYTLPNETVLDFTMGSGSTGVACVNTNRNFIGIELDKKYFDIATNRIEEAKSKI